jgi:sarcosine oxidase subunit delta
MLLIPCPHCGERAESEYHYGGEAHIARPYDPAKASDAEWADYLFFRKNTKGVTFERWLHAQGCRRWFNVARHTVTYEILAVYEMGTPAPKLDTQSEI